MRSRSKLRPTFWWVMLVLVAFWLLASWGFLKNFAVPSP
jgi:hypothetical protein